MNPYRPHVGQTVRVDHRHGSATGTLWSVTPNSLWLLVEEADVFIPVADVVTCETA
jgi:hypothetical protein